MIYERHDKGERQRVGQAHNFFFNFENLSIPPPPPPSRQRTTLFRALGSLACLAAALVFLAYDLT